MEVSHIKAKLNFIPENDFEKLNDGELWYKVVFEKSASFHQLSNTEKFHELKKTLLEEIQNTLKYYDDSTYVEIKIENNEKNVEFLCQTLKCFNIDTFELKNDIEFYLDSEQLFIKIALIFVHPYVCHDEVI